MYRDKVNLQGVRTNEFCIQQMTVTWYYDIVSHTVYHLIFLIPLNNSDTRVSVIVCVHACMYVSM